MINLFAFKIQKSKSQTKSILFLILMTYPCFISAQITRTWTGTVNTVWEFPSNWSPSGIPNPQDDVVIPDVNTNDPIINGIAFAGSITVESGGFLTISSGVEVSITASDNHGIDNDGRVDNEGTISVTMPSNVATVNGIDNSDDFNNLSGAVINIDGVSNIGIRNRNGSNFDNAGEIIIGETSAVGSSSIHNATTAAFYNSECQALIHIFSSELFNNGTFTNDGNIVEEAGSTYNSSITINNGIVQNLNGGTFTINNDNGLYDTEGKKYWSGCQSNNWHASKNWHDHTVPNSSDEVMLSDIAVNDVSINSLIALAKSIEISTSRILEIQSSASLLINGAIGDGMQNEGVVTIAGNVQIGNISSIGDDGIDNHGTLNVSPNGIINIQNTAESGINHEVGSIVNDGEIVVDNTGSSGIYSESSFTNQGQIEIGQNGASNSIDYNGIRSDAAFTNAVGATIIIDHTSSSGIIHLNDALLFSNAGTIELGQSGSSNSVDRGIACVGLFKNESGGVITIDNAGWHAIDILSSGDSFTNAGQIKIGQNGGSSNINSSGIVNTGTFTNEANSSIIVDNVGINGFDNESSGTAYNAGTIQIGVNGGVNNIEADGVFNENNFENTIGAILSIADVASDGVSNEDDGKFTNSGSIFIDGTGEIGINNYADFDILIDAILTIDNAGTDGIFNNEEGNLTTYGSISIQNISLAGFNNYSEDCTNFGRINIDNAGTDALYTDGYFSNEGSLLIGQNGGAGNIALNGINNNKDLNNNGTIIIDNVTEYGLKMQDNNNPAPTFTNSGSLLIGQNGGTNNIGQDGILSYARITNSSTGSIVIDNTANDGFKSNYYLENQGSIDLGQNSEIDRLGLYLGSQDSIINNGQINIDATGDDAFFMSTNSTFVNMENAVLNIGINTGTVGGFGMYSWGNVTNSGQIKLDGIAQDAMRFAVSSWFINNVSGTLLIGQNHGVGDEGIHFSSADNEFLNDGGNIEIDNVAGSGIEIFRGTFTNTNSGEILIGYIGAIGKDGIYIDSDSELSNKNNANLKIDNIDDTDSYALWIADGAKLKNKATASILIGDLGMVRHGINNDGSVTNESSIVVADLIESSLYNESTGLFDNVAGAIFSCADAIENLGGEINNDGDITALYTFDNEGTVDGSGIITVGYLWINNGTLIGTGTVLFSGYDGNAEIQGGVLTNFYNLEIDKSVGQVNLNQDIKVRGTLQLSSGNLDLNSHLITLGSNNGTIEGESPQGYLYSSLAGAQITKTSTLNAPQNENPGNIGTTITSSVDLGTTTIIRGYDVQNVNGESSIERYYDISHDNSVNPNATVRFYYLDHELNGIDESNLTPFRFNSSYWEDYPVTAFDMDENYIETSNIIAFSVWTLAGSASVLPVELVYFQARAIDNEQVELTWQTALEENNDFFIVERSSDGTHFELLEKIPGAGSSTQLLAYHAFDEQPFAGFNYYRLQQTNFDGTTAFSEIQVVNIEKPGIKLSVFPNPASDVLNIQWNNSVGYNSFNNSITLIEIYEEMGKLVMRKTVNPMEPSHSIKLDHLPKGLYWLRVTSDGKIFNEKVITQ